LDKALNVDESKNFFKFQKIFLRSNYRGGMISRIFRHFSKWLENWSNKNNKHNNWGNKTPSNFL